MLEITIRFDSWSEMIAFAQANAGRIAPADVPSVGAPEPAPAAQIPFPPALAPAAADPAAIFGGTPVAVVSPPPAPVTVSVAAESEVDKSGLRWDPRIHGANKTKNADGTWRQKRGLEKEDPDGSMRKRVEAELRGPVTQISPQAVVTPATPFPAPLATPPAPPAPPTVVVAPTAPATSTPPAAAPQWSFARLLTAVSAGGPAGIAKSLETISQFGPKTMPELAAASSADPTLCDTIALALGLS